MTSTNPAASSEEWEQRVSDLWAAISDYDADAFINKMAELTAELSNDNPVGLFEQASAYDSTGHSDKAVPLYEKAIGLGLDSHRRRRAVIQMASSMRNLGKAEESVALLRAEQARESDELDDAVSAFLALALVDMGHEREAVSIALAALASHLPRYQVSTANYARLLVNEN
jgi:tetratricopeptide (TPR) repeat protein